MAVVAALVCIFVVMSLSAVAISDSVGSLANYAQNRNSLLSVDAASSGIQAELAAMKAALPGTTSGQHIPCSDGQVTVDQASSGTPDIQDAAGTESYLLSLGSPSTSAPSMGTRLGSASACSAAGFQVPSGTPWYLLVQSQGVVSAKAGGNGRTVQAVVKVGNASQSAAQAINLALLNNTVSYTSPATSASNSGSGPNNAVSTQVSLSIPGTDNFVGLTAATQVAEANTDGTSYACSGDLSTGDTLGTGGYSSPCSTSGSGTGGVWLDLSKLPGVVTALSSLVADIKLTFNAVSSWAACSAGSATCTGSATLGGVSVTVTLLSGIPVGPLSVSLPAGAISSPTNVIPLVISALQGNVLTSALATTISNALSPVLSLTAGYQTDTAGVETVDGLHLALLSAGVATGATANLAVSQAGKNTTNNSFTLQGTKQV